MSNRRTLLWLLTGVMLALAALFTGRTSNEAVQMSGRAELHGIFASRGIRLERLGGVPIRLEKDERWQLCEPFVAGADEARVLRLLDSFAEMSILDFLSADDLQREGRGLADFALDKPVLKAEFTRSDGKLAVALGRPTPTADGIYARIGEEPGVFVVRSEILNAADLTVDELRRRSLFLIGPESVAAFDIRRGAGARLAFARTADGWQLNGEAASAPNVNKFLEILTSAKVQSFVWPLGVTNETREASAALLAGYGLDPESAVTVTLKGHDGRDRVLSLGKGAGADRVYALAHNGSAVVTVSVALRGASEADVRLFTDSRLFPVAAAAVAYFSIKDGETAYVLARAGADAWRLESPVAAPADSEQVNALLTKILDLSPADVNPEGLEVSLSTNAPVFSVTRSRLVDMLGFDSLRSREVLNLNPAQIKRLVRNDGKHPPVAVVYARDRQAWNLEHAEGSARVDEAGVATILKALSPLTAERVERLKVSTTDLDDYGLNAPVLTLAIDQEGTDSVRRNLIIGGATEGGRFATLGSADAVFVLGDSVINRLSTMPASFQ